MYHSKTNSFRTSKNNSGTSFWMQVVEMLDMVGERRFGCHRLYVGLSSP